MKRVQATETCLSIIFLIDPNRICVIIVIKPFNNIILFYSYLPNMLAQTTTGEMIQEIIDDVIKAVLLQLSQTQEGKCSNQDHTAVPNAR